MKASLGGGNDFELPAEGLTIGRCYKVVDCGTHTGNFGPKREIMVHFELPFLKMEVDGVEMPMSISKKYNLSFNAKANLRKDIEAWYGKKFNDKDIENSGGFDPSKILGRSAQVLIEHATPKDRTYANIVGLMPLAEGQTCPDQVNDNFFFDFDEFSIDKWESMGEKFRSWLAESPEAKQALQQGQGQQNEAIVDEDFDSLPF